MDTLFDFLLRILSIVASFGTWLVTPLNYVNMSPLALFSIAGVTAIITIHLIRLFVGG